MPYLPDLKFFPLSDYQEFLMNKNLLPGRVGLRENIERYFDAMRSAGITDVDGLSKALSTPQKLEQLARQTSIPAAYLVLLKREVGSLLPKPLPVRDLIGLDENTAGSLAGKGIKTTKDFYETYQAGGFDALPAQTAEDLFAQCDLVRINGMGPLAAKLFMAAGYGSCEAVAGADADEMLERVLAANAAGAFYTGKLGLKDMQFCIDNAKLLAKFP